MTASRSPDVTEQADEFMSTLPQYPSQPTRSIIDAVDVVAEMGPTLGRPLVDRIELEPDHRELIKLFGRQVGRVERLVSAGHPGSGAPLPRLPGGDQPEVT